jgi:hypothetical protein
MGRKQPLANVSYRPKAVIRHVLTSALRSCVSGEKRSVTTLVSGLFKRVVRRHQHYFASINLGFEFVTATVMVDLYRVSSILNENDKRRFGG